MHGYDADEIQVLSNHDAAYKFGQCGQEVGNVSTI